jgi:hypothetical protein
LPPKNDREDSDEQQINPLIVLRSVLNNLRATSKKQDSGDIWYLEKGIVPIRPAKRSLADSAEVDTDELAPRMSRSENRFLQIQGLDNHLAHMSRPR